MFVRVVRHPLLLLLLLLLPLLLLLLLLLLLIDMRMGGVSARRNVLLLRLPLRLLLLWRRVVLQVLRKRLIFHVRLCERRPT